MDKRNLKIVYSRYEGPEKRALELIYREVEEIVLRDGDRYVHHVLACERADVAVLDKTAIILGMYDENLFLQRYIDKSEIPAGGYLVRVPILVGIRHLPPESQSHLPLFRMARGLGAFAPHPSLLLLPAGAPPDGGKRRPCIRRENIIRKERGCLIKNRDF